MKDGFRIWDTDTHIRPSLEALDPHFDAAMRARLPELDQYKRVNRRDIEGLVPGHHGYGFGDGIDYPRTLGRAEADPEGSREKTYQGGRHATRGAHDDDPHARIGDMDEEGVDVQLLIGRAPYPSHLDRELQVGFMRAYNRFLNDFCGKYPHRLKAVLSTLPNAVEESVAEIKQWGKAPWMAGIYPPMDNETPMDYPDLDPIWRAIGDLGKVVIHHSHYGAPPHFPGYVDVWDNVFLARSAAHPWGAMRAIGAFIGAGIMERYPSLRFGILESGCGWLPFWLRRLDDQAEYVGGVPHLQQTIGEQMTGGRFFSSLEMAEGEDMIQMVVDFLGPDVLMYASDYPHFECRFPNSVNYFMNWDLSDDVRRKMFWENPVRFYGEP